MKKYILIILLFLSVGFYSCSTIKPPDPVCDYGLIICDFTDYLCRTYPGTLPEEFCFYSYIACANLTMLCDSTLNDSQKAVLYKTQQNINKRFKESLERSKQ